MLEVQPDFPDRHDAVVGCELAQRIDVGIGRLEREMSGGRPDLAVLVCERNRVAASFKVDSHGDHAGHTGMHRVVHHWVDIAELLQVEVRVYEDAAGSSSVGSSRRLNNAFGSGRGWPGLSSDGRQRFISG